MWLTTKDLLKGYKDFPPISYQTQCNLRTRQALQFMKIGRSIYYRPEWVENYFLSQISPVKDKAK